MIEAVLWDLGGVLTRFDRRRRSKELAYRTGHSPARVEAVLDANVLTRLDAGDISGQDLVELLRTELGCDGTYEEIGRAWTMAFEPDPGVLGLASRVTAPAAVLTNNGPPLSDLYQQLLPSVARVVPRAFFSARTGHTKPAAEAFTAPCQDLGVEPAATLFIDDSLANVGGARSAGLKACRYQAPEQLERYLASTGLIG